MLKQAAKELAAIGFTRYLKRRVTQESKFLRHE
jgi:hypothetical protein